MKKRDKVKTIVLGVTIIILILAAIAVISTLKSNTGSSTGQVIKNTPSQSKVSESQYPVSPLPSTKIPAPPANLG